MCILSVVMALVSTHVGASLARRLWCIWVVLASLGTTIAKGEQYLGIGMVCRYYKNI